MNWFKKKPSLPLSQIKLILTQAQTCRQERLTKAQLDDLELDIVYFQIQQQIRWIEALKMDISALTDSSWTLGEEIKFTELCKDPVRELCVLNHPTARMIRIEQLLEEDVHFVKQNVYQEIRQVTLELKELAVVNDPTEIVKQLKTKLERYFRRRFKLQGSQALDLIVEHYIHARIGVLYFMGAYSYEHSFLIQYRMKPSNVSARSVLDIQGFKPPKLERAIDLLSNMPVLMPETALQEWRNVIETIKQETFVKNDCHLLLCIIFALTQSHNFNVIHLLCSVPHKVPEPKRGYLSYLNAAKVFIVQKKLIK